MKKKLLIILSIIVLIIIVLICLFLYFRPDNYEKDKTKNVKVTGNYTNTLIKETKEYKKIDISKVLNIEIIKFTEGGRESEFIEDKNQINSIYTSLGNIKIGTKNDTKTEDNTTIYSFNSKKESVSFEFEWKNIIINNQGYSYTGNITY